MASTAISAQGSTVQIASGTSGAKTITGVAVGNPTIITSTAHGLVNGDVVTFAGLTGTDAALLNGQTFVVKNKTTNTFAVDCRHHRQDHYRRLRHGNAGCLDQDRERQAILWL